VELVVEVVSWIFISAGCVFVMGGAVGVIRMPDLFTRQHAAGMTDTAGAGLMLIGMLFQAGPNLIGARLVFILLFIAFTSPVATHALCRAALEAGVEPHGEGGEA
jgi:multicomponent Na+:H+ antiporter subunit G